MCGKKVELFDVCEDCRKKFEMKEPMKCERIVYEWETQDILRYDKKGNTFRVKTNRHKHVCSGELEEKGQIDNYGLGLEVQTIYQCKSCGDIKII